MILIENADGDLLIMQTTDCAIYASYANRLAPSPIDAQTYVLGGFTVIVVKGPHDLPETLIVRDAFGNQWAESIPEGEAGAICVPAVMS